MSTLTYSSSLAYIASVNATGVVTGVANGRSVVTVTETESGKTGTATIQVVNGSAPQPPPAGTIGFTGAANYPFTGNPGQFVTGDFDGDGNQDVAVSGAGDTIAIYYGNGDGTLRAPVTVFTGKLTIYPVATADFNRDGKLDLVCVDSDGDIYVLFSQGVGSFRSVPVPLSVGKSQIVVGDFNGDGYPDIASTFDNVQGFGIAILTNQGGTSFSLTKTIPLTTGSDWFSLVGGDFNNDGKIDLVAVSAQNVTSQPGGIEVFLGKGDGTFTTGAAYSGFAPAYDVQAIDLNHDGNLDLILWSNGFSVYLGNGDGTFRAPSNYATSVLSIADFWNFTDITGNGLPDLATQASASSPELAVSPNQGNGVFSAPMDVNLGVGGPLYFGATADLNGDGRPDFIISTHGYLSVLLNTSH